MNELDKKINDLKEFIKQKTDQGTANYLGKEIREICGMVETEKCNIDAFGISNTMPEDPIELARYLHDNYEMIAKKQNWNTQENCKVDFSDLPVGNKNTMILLAGKLIFDFGGN